jgi:hypothetical protein
MQYEKAPHKTTVSPEYYFYLVAQGLVAQGPDDRPVVL